ncbi:DUF445 domain-containing protein [Trichlorobacter lovleyi]|uniref:Transmembrane protein n=1 Tax=Trichlorobacter lovleyi (strain ATCC BAA-1151 / DSM 17278 / SZ) TaxID=398767 RepID=B3E919_TRIL1|nr:DUF445 domain-containing protein [Trichlorobacter lovleyi]ACD96732.1 protein of unknown function DUF445 [Trichlorobacter lovleyi SZ]
METRRKLLIRNKRIATGLMIGAALLFVVARLQNGHGAWEWVAAFAEAAMVGALADWFAVVALFRHPLGLPIPHTAIIKHKQGAIAGNLATFIRDKFLASDTLIAKLRAYNPAEQLAVYLMAPQHAADLSRGVTRLLLDSLDFIDDERVQQWLRAALGSRVERFDLSGTAGAMLQALRNDNRHQVVLDDLLKRLAAWLATEQAQSRLASSIDEMVTKEYPLLSVFIPNREQFTRGAGEKVAGRINDFIQAVNADPGHELRQSFDAAVMNLVARLQNDPELRNKVEGVKQEVLHNQAITDYARNIGNDLKSWLQHDLQQSDSKLQQKITAAVAGLGTTLSDNQGLKDSLNDYLAKLVLHYGDTLRNAVAGHIAGTVQTWDSADYSNEIELSIGSDLQFIRMNGTLVGGVIGLLLHALALLLA